jgi:hypothetical protein
MKGVVSCLLISNWLLGIWTNLINRREQNTDEIKHSEIYSYRNISRTFALPLQLGEFLFNTV